MKIGLRDTAVDVINRNTHELVSKGWSYTKANNKVINDFNKMFR